MATRRPTKIEFTCGHVATASIEAESARQFDERARGLTRVRCPACQGISRFPTEVELDVLAAARDYDYPRSPGVSPEDIAADADLGMRAVSVAIKHLLGDGLLRSMRGGRYRPTLKGLHQLD